MVYKFRGHIIFEYNEEFGYVIQHDIKNIGVPAFNHCRFIDEDYKLMSEFFNMVYLHRTGVEVELKDIIVS
jgi:hypothetical protein